MEHKTIMSILLSKFKQGEVSHPLYFCFLKEVFKISVCLLKVQSTRVASKMFLKGGTFVSLWTFLINNFLIYMSDGAAQVFRVINSSANLSNQDIYAQQSVPNLR